MTMKARPTFPCYLRVRALLRLAGTHELVGRALERSSARTPEHYFLDLAGELEVLVGDTARGVVLELHPHLRPGHSEVRVMIRGFGQVADRVHQHERRGP